MHKASPVSNVWRPSVVVCVRTWATAVGLLQYTTVNTVVCCTTWVRAEELIREISVCCFCSAALVAHSWLRAPGLHAADTAHPPGVWSSVSPPFPLLSRSPRGNRDRTTQPQLTHRPDAPLAGFTSHGRQQVDHPYIRRKPCSSPCESGVSHRWRILEGDTDSLAAPEPLFYPNMTSDLPGAGVDRISLHNSSKNHTFTETIISQLEGMTLYVFRLTHNIVPMHIYILEKLSLCSDVTNNISNTK